MKFDIDRAVCLTMNVLKDFQQATVERIDHLFFENGQNRILIADEVGMGKTVVARGVIVKTAQRHKKKGDPLFKVVYICSNLSIANQNIQKLRISSKKERDDISNTRLSMQHLKIKQQELDQNLLDDYIQMIPLTPDTSFRITNGGGTANERALMFAILQRMPEFSEQREELKSFLKYGVSKDSRWDYYIQTYEDAVRDCEERSNRTYPADLINRILEYDLSEQIITLVRTHLEELKSGTAPTQTDRHVLNKLRVMFARLSTQMLDPDLVIMDEFQRFRFLIESQQETDTGILAHQFLDKDNVKILLLSATPYKLYSTLEEIDEANGVDEHYREFLQVMDFLFKGKTSEFRRVWSDYNIALHELQEGDTSIIQIKNEAEDAMYQGVCRTERISVMDSGDYIDSKKARSPLTVTENDIRSYLELGKLLKDIGASFHVPIDYVKSSPFLMSFMQNYKVKENIENYFKIHPEKISLADRDLLWVDDKKVDRYQELPAANARLEKLKEQVFENNAELYLWIPPSKPYYHLQGVYKNSQHYSKILVFSAWEMVPRMIGTMISYEAERRTIGKVCANAKINEINNRRYFAERRYPYPRLDFSVKQNKPQSMALFCLLYPSRTLADIYDPIQSLNKDMSLKDIKKDIKVKLQSQLDVLRKYQKKPSKKEDPQWYYLSPMLMDGKAFVDRWINAITQMMKCNTKEEEDDKSTAGKNKQFHLHIRQLVSLLDQGQELALGPMPKDLAETLADIALGSPAVCIYRSDRKNVNHAVALARIFLDYFNTRESTAAIQLAAEKDTAHRHSNVDFWKDVLRYCEDGCFQAMFDEYRHIVADASSFASAAEEKDEQIQSVMAEDLNLHTASYKVDTYETFKGRLEGKSDSRRMRAHYAVGFVNSERADDQQSVVRRDRIRGAFNSPLRPFVLATTSIGQEGLDFHNYCRRVMHWNLPANPIDLEQREGRINRYKCLAIRQDIADSYGRKEFCGDVWKDMFDAAESDKKDSQSDLVPYWCLGRDQKIKIERIVPMYPMSRDGLAYERIIKILSLYRLSLGQARQEELMEYLFHFEDQEALKKLFIDLCPFSKEGIAEKRVAGYKYAPCEYITCMESDAQTDVDELEEQLSAIEKEILQKKQLIAYPDCKGLKVFHKKYGTGHVTQSSNNKIYIDFGPNGKKKFNYPDAFLKGALQTEAGSVTEGIKQVEKQKQELTVLEEQAERIREGLSEDNNTR